MATVSDALARLGQAEASGALETLCRRRRVDLLVLFGSALTSQAPGDVDLAVAFEPGFSRNLLDFADELADLVPGDHLDIMPLDSAGPVAGQRALTRGRVLFATSPRAFFDRQTFFINHYIDTQPMRDALLESLRAG